MVIGQSASPTIGETRTEEDLLKHINRAAQLSPDSRWRFILDQLNTHQSESLVMQVIAMDRLNIPSEEFG